MIQGLRRTVLIRRPRRTQNGEQDVVMMGQRGGVAGRQKRTDVRLSWPCGGARRCGQPALRCEYLQLWPLCKAVAEKVQAYAGDVEIRCRYGNDFFLFCSQFIFNQQAGGAIEAVMHRAGMSRDYSYCCCFPVMCARRRTQTLHTRSLGRRIRARNEA